MIKTTAKELKRNARFTDRKELISFLESNDLKIVGHPERVAYCESVYGCGGYLLRYTLDSGLSVTAFTGRSSWMYSCENAKELGESLYI